jgi:small multidrug resistance pump
MFGRALERGMRLGVGYGTLTSCGLAAATLASVVLFDDAVSAVQLVGIVVIGVGAVLLQTGSSERAE